MNNTNYLQALLAINAARITDIEADIGDLVVDAKYWAANNERSFSAEAYDKADRLRRKLAKLVERQRTYKTELLHIHRVARIARKIVLLKVKAGINFVAPDGLTSLELENDLDDIIFLTVPKKPDSRQKAAA